jgi:outer membrane protein assembly factor BamD (BamD/ComL family)
MSPRPLSWLRRPALGLLALATATTPALTLAQAPKAEAKKAEAKKAEAPAPTPPTPARAKELRFLDGLRGRGYFDLAAEYLRALRDDPRTTPEQKVVLDYEEGRGLLDEATRLADLERRRALLEQARGKLDAFTKAHPDHPLAPEALVGLARLLLERGQTAALLAEEEPPGTARNARLGEARARYAEARVAFEKAIAPLRAAYAAFPKSLEPDDPRRERRDLVRVALIDAEYQRAQVDFLDALALPADNPERTKLLDGAQVAFHDLTVRYDKELAAFFARLGEGRCLEEKGDLGPAMAIYNDLLGPTDPVLRPLQREVAYLRIVVHGKRNEPALAADRALEWMRAYPEAATTKEGVGARFLLAKNLLAQLPKAANDNERQAATRRATDLLAEVVRYASPFKPEALELLRKYRPSVAADATAVANLSYEDAVAGAESALSTKDYDQAVALCKQALRRAADPRVDSEPANRARFLLAYALYESKRYYESAAVAEFLARRYPKWGLAPKAAEIGLAAWNAAYNAYRNVQSTPDLDRWADFATYTANTWPDAEQGADAAILLGDIRLGVGRFPEAAAAYEGVRPDSPRKLDADVKAGEARWRQAVRLRGQMQEAEAAAEAQRAREVLEAALAARRKANPTPTDPGLLKNLNALAELHRGSGRPKEAIALLEPAAKALEAAPAGNGPDAAPRIAAETILLRSYIADGQADRAIAAMASLQKAGGAGAALTPLYFELGRSLKAEIAALESQPGDAAKARRDATRKAYVQFLEALAGSTAGQTFESLHFAGDSLLAIGRPDGVLKIAEQALALPELKGEPDASPKRLRAELLQARALRQTGQFDAALARAAEISRRVPRMLEPMMEQGYLHEDRAKATGKKEDWSTAYSYWSRLGGSLARARPRPVAYFEAQYHAALALQGLKQNAQAAQLLKGVLTLSPTAGSPEWKAKYAELIGQLGR